MTDTLVESACRLEDLRAVVAQRTDPHDFPHAVAISHEVLIYDAQALPPADELVRAFADGPGVVVVRAAFPDTTVVDRATAVFEALIAAEPGRGDHFAAAGTNDRLWNALEKLAVRAPEVFVDYYANPTIAAVARAWLGPGYQVTSQVNVVHPGGAAQVGHRDYHLGFLPAALIEQFPRHVHRLSPVLTLQGAVAHVDMPLDSGPTLYLPHSQKYEPGYLAMHRPEFRAWFAQHHVQLPLRKGDAAFFNPAVIHAAGTNRSADVHRLANLLQISSAFGRAMEHVDRTRMVVALYPVLRGRPDRGTDTDTGTGNVVAAAAEGYPFPTNLDLDPPIDGLAPASQADVLRRALAQGWSTTQLRAAMAEHALRRTSPITHEEGSR